MLTEPLPRTLDVRKAAVRGVRISGALEPRQLPRFRALLAGEEGHIAVELAFSRDEENRYLVQVTATAEVSVECQRCLEPMTVALSADNTLAIVWTDEQAAVLPRYLEPLVAAEEGCNLWEMVEDELILALPAYSYHDTDECRNTMAGYVGAEPEQPEERDRPNPFEVLAQLKPGSEH